MTSHKTHELCMCLLCAYIYIATTTHSLSPFSGSSLCSHLIALASPHHSNQISVTWNLEPGFFSSSSNVNIIIYTPIIPNAAASTPEAACVIPEFTPPAATPAAAAADELEQRFLQHFRQMKPKDNWIEEVLLDLRVVLESKEFEIERLRRKVKKLMTERAKCCCLTTNKSIM